MYTLAVLSFCSDYDFVNKPEKKKSYNYFLVCGNNNRKEGGGGGCGWMVGIKALIFSHSFLQKNRASVLFCVTSLRFSSLVLPSQRGVSNVASIKTVSR